MDQVFNVVESSIHGRVQAFDVLVKGLRVSIDGRVQAFDVLVNGLRVRVQSSIDGRVHAVDFIVDVIVDGKNSQTEATAHQSHHRHDNKKDLPKRRIVRPGFDRGSVSAAIGSFVR